MMTGTVTGNKGRLSPGKTGPGEEVVRVLTAFSLWPELVQLCLLAGAPKYGETPRHLAGSTIGSRAPQAGRVPEAVGSPAHDAPLHQSSRGEPPPATLCWGGKPRAHGAGGRLVRG